METNINSERDQELWHIARKRVKFKRHLALYVLLHIWFWAIWYFSDEKESELGLAWPAWSMIGWGIGLAFSYLNAYVLVKQTAIQREYDKMKNRY